MWKRLFGLSAVGLIPAVPQLNGNHPQRVQVAGTRQGSRSQRKWQRPQAGFGMASHIDEEAKQNPALAEAFSQSSYIHLAFHPRSSTQFLCWSPARNRERARPPSPPNLSIALAQLGQRVLLVDADLRSPSLHRLFGVRENLGLVNYLTGHQDWHTVVRPSGCHGLDLLFCGPIPPNPSELLSSRSMGELIRSAREQYQFVILDSAPMLGPSRTAAFSPRL